MAWKCPPLHLRNWNNFWKWKTEMKYDQEVYEALAENERNKSTVKSPCIGKCTYDITIMKCNDCGRTKEQISNWYVMTDDEKLAVLEQLLKEQE